MTSWVYFRQLRSNPETWFWDVERVLSGQPETTVDDPKSNTLKLTGGKLKQQRSFLDWSKKNGGLGPGPEVPGHGYQGPDEDRGEKLADDGFCNGK